MNENAVKNPASTNEPTIIQTDVGAKDGQNKCPKCGATDISLNVHTGKLRCNFCRFEFEPGKVAGLDQDISTLQGATIGSGAQNIVADTKDVLTFKCSSCGAEVVIDTASSTNARCHWCRNILSVNQQIPNGSIPDVVLPFKVSKNEAKAQIEKFVSKRKFYAHPKFKAEFTTENIMGVYFPYMVVDINSHAKFTGQGEHLVRRYTEKSGDSYDTYYDADLYSIGREFDLAIDGLTVESNTERLNKNSSQTNNVINAIMPFDIENCVKYDANYLRGYTSEKRDINVDELKNLVYTQAKDVARFAANDTLKYYDRGVCFHQEKVDVKGELWQAAYLPVWLYSYQQVSGDKKVLHYVAVNARTKETMGSVPVHMPKLLAVSFVVEIFGVMLMLFVDSDYSFLFLLAGFLYFFIIFLKYRNTNARHHHETETKTKMENLQKKDILTDHLRGLSNARMRNANNTRVSNQGMSESFLNSISNAVPIQGLFNEDSIEEEEKK